MALIKLMIANFLKTIIQRIKREIDFFRKKPAELLGVNKLAEVTFKTIKNKIKDLILKNANAILLLAADKLLSDILTQKNVNINDKNKSIDPLSDEIIIEYCSRSKNIRKILDSVDKSFDNDIAGEIANACGKSNISEIELDSLMGKLGIEDINGEDLIKSINSNSDLDRRSDSLNSNQKSLLDSIWEIIPYIMLILLIVIKAEEFLKQNEFPSKYRGKYLSKLIPSVTRMIKSTLNKEIITPAKKGYNQLSTAYKTTKESLQNIEAPKVNVPSLSKEGLDFLKSVSEPILSGLKLIDAAIGAVMLSTAMYLFNRKRLQEISMDGAKENFSSDSVLSCDKVEFIEPFNETPLNRNLLKNSNLIDLPKYIDSSFRCPNNLDDELTPSKPIEDGKDLPDCPVILSIPEPPVIEVSEPILSNPPMAKFRFIKKGPINPSINLKKDQEISIGDSVFTFKTGNRESFTSPIYGKVLSLDNNKLEVIVEKYEIPDSKPPEEKALEELNTLYSEKSKIEEFINNFYVESSFPILLGASPTNGSVLSSSQWANIIYRSGGVTQHWESLKKAKKRLDEDFNKKIKKIASADNIKSALSSKDSNTDSILANINTEKNKYFDSLIKTRGIYYNRSERTSSKKEEYTLASYYFQLWNTLIDYQNVNQTIQYVIDTPPADREENKILSVFRDIIAEILLYRIPYDKFSIKNVEEKINSLCKQLSGNSTLRLVSQPNTNYFKEIDKIFSDYSKSKYQNINIGALYLVAAASLFPQSKVNSAKDDFNPNKIGISRTQSDEIFKGTIGAISSYLVSIGEKNKNIEEAEKNSISYQIVSLYTLIKASLYSALPDSSLSVYKLTLKESNKINSYLESKIKKLNSIDDEINRNIKYLGGIGKELSPAGTEITEEIEYSIYSASHKRECPIPSEPGDYLSAISESEFKDIKYWRRYMNFATLSSVVSGTWATGILPPVGPIPLPTIYVPIKAWQKEWGIVVIGLTITGIYPFPFLLVANLSTNPQVAFGNPAGSLKKEIKTTKEELLQKTANLKRGILKPLIDESFQKISGLQQQKSAVSVSIIENSLKRPQYSKYKDPVNKIKNAKLKIQYVKDLEKWTVLSISLREKKLSLSSQIFQETLKYRALKSVSRGTKKAKDFIFPQFKPIEAAEKSINSVFSRLEKIAEKIDVFIAKLPIATLAGSANFGPTIKNPKPITQIDRGLIDDLVDQNYLDNLMKSFELKNEWLMSSKFGAFANNSFLNNKKVKESLALASIILIPKDPFPKYENLKISNVGWFVRFLLPKWAPTGAGQFGFPGFPQFPKK